MFSFVFFLTALMAVVLSSYSFAQKINKVNGAVGLGYTKGQVLKALGDPASPQKFDFFYERGEDELIVCFDDKTKLVECIIVRGKSQMYSAGGIKIGDARSNVIKTYGKPERVVDYRKSGVECWYYPSQNVNFAISGDKVSSFGVSNVTLVKR